MKSFLKYKEDIVLDGNIFGAHQLTFIRKAWEYKRINIKYDIWDTLKPEPMEHTTYYIFDKDFLGDFTFLEMMDIIERTTFTEDGKYDYPISSTN